MKWLNIILLGVVLAKATAFGSEFVESPDRHNVVWDSPSNDQHGSMPLGNGSTGLNAWIEPNGDLVFTIGRTDSWGDNGRLLKLGKVRIKLDPAPSTDDFLQTLNLRNTGVGGEIASCNVFKASMDEDDDGKKGIKPNDMFNRENQNIPFYIDVSVPSNSLLFLIIIFIFF